MTGSQVLGWRVLTLLHPPVPPTRTTITRQVMTAEARLLEQLGDRPYRRRRPAPTERPVPYQRWL